MKKEYFSRWIIGCKNEISQRSCGWFTAQLKLATSSEMIYFVDLRADHKSREMRQRRLSE